MIRLSLRVCPMFKYVLKHRIDFHGNRVPFGTLLCAAVCRVLQYSCLVEEGVSGTIGYYYTVLLRCSSNVLTGAGECGLCYWGSE